MYVSDHELHEHLEIQLAEEQCYICECDLNGDETESVPVMKDVTEEQVADEPIFYISCCPSCKSRLYNEVVNGLLAV